MHRLPAHHSQPPSAHLAPTPAMTGTSSHRRPVRKPGRPAVYTFDNPENLTPEERKKMNGILKRRKRQNRAYRRRRDSRLRRENDVSSAQVVPDVPLAASLPIPHPLPHGVAAVVPAQSSHSWPSQQQDVPRFISGFSQNPLDLLASASGTGPHAASITSTATSLPFVSTESIADTSPSLNPEPLVSTTQPSRGSLQPDITFRDTGATRVSPTESISPPPGDSLTIQIDATAAQPLDVSPFPFALDKPKDQHEEEATDVTASCALVAAKEYPRGFVSLKDTVDRESELQRRTSIITIVFDNLRTKYMSMDPGIQDALRHFVIFPRTFNLQAAVSVAGLKETQFVDMQRMLDSMIQSNFIKTSKGRYELNEAARRFLNEDENVFNDSLSNNTYDTAQSRFVKHYQAQLSGLQDDNIHRIGWLREQAMALYDSERENMVFSEYLFTGKKEKLREFLSAGITVMRYCVSAADRENVLRKALADDETSTEDIALSYMGDDPAMETSSMKPGEKTAQKSNSHHARLQLALSEAYFDQLKTQEAEQALMKAFRLMGDLTPQSQKTPQAGVVDSVLVLLLLSNLMLGANKIKDARTLCIRALNILKHATLGRSTFGINAMSNLVTIFLREGDVDMANDVASKLLDTLNTMRYTGMPIYADALGVCAQVSMAKGNYVEAERQYGTALETVGKWGSKEWTGVPVQHCLDLDLWLMEGFAEAIRKQGRVEEAQLVERKASADRESRGLSRNQGGIDDYPDADTHGSGGPSPKADSRKILRHLY